MPVPWFEAGIVKGMGLMLTWHADKQPTMLCRLFSGVWSLEYATEGLIAYIRVWSLDKKKTGTYRMIGAR